MPDAYLCEDLISPFETNILSADEFEEFDIPTIAGTLNITELELVCSFDHGNRTAEELCLDIAATAGDLIMARVLVLCGLDVHLVDCFGLVAEEFHAERASWGSWSCDNGDDAQALYEFIDYQIAPMLGDCGFVFEQSGDAGMTWIYAPTGQGPTTIALPPDFWEG